MPRETQIPTAKLPATIELGPEGLRLNVGGADPNPDDEPEPTTITKEGVTTTPQPESDPLQDAIWNLNEREMILEAEIEELAKKVKSKKAELETTADEKRRLIRATRESLPLFDRKPEPEPFEAGDETPPETTAEDWLSIPVSALVHYGMPKKYISILAESSVHTIGDIKAIGDKGLALTEVKGVGEAADDKIHTALNGLWEARNEAAAAMAFGDEAEDAEEHPEDYPDDEDDDAAYDQIADDETEGGDGD